MVPAQLNGEISMSRTTACLTRIAASEQFLFRIHHAPNRPYLITPDLSGDDLVLLQFESVQRRQFSRSLFSTEIKSLENNVLIDRYSDPASPSCTGPFINR